MQILDTQDEYQGLFVNPSYNMSSVNVITDNPALSHLSGIKEDPGLTISPVKIPIVW